MTDQPQRPLDPQEIEAYLLGHLPQERVAVLDTALHDDVAALNQFAQAMQVMSLVRQEFAGQAQYQAANKQEPLLEDFNTLLKELGQQEAAAEPITLPIEQAAFHATPAIQTERMSVGEVLSLSSYVLRKAITSRPAILSAAAAIVLLATALFFNWGGSDNGEEIVKSPTDNIVTTPEAAIVATLTAEQDSQWAEGALAPGSQLHPGDRLTLTAGFAEITTEEGAVVILEAPATVELLDNDNAIRLHAGKLVGICETESSVGFVVRTPHADVTDLGTRFGVHVEQTFSQPTHVQVFQGSVLMESLAEETVTLFGGQAKAAGAEGLVETRFDTARYAQAVTGRAPLADLAANPFGIANPSFEWVALEDGDLSRKEVPGWTLSHPKAAVVANPAQGVTLYYDPALSLDTNGGTVGDMHGRCVFFFSADQPDASLSQTLATQAEVGTTYTLIVAIGDRMEKAIYRPDFAGYNIELLAGDQVLASLNATPDQSPGKGTFTDVALTYTVQLDDPTGPLGIRLSTNRSGESQVTDFDNIRLTSNRPADTSQPASQ